MKTCDCDSLVCDTCGGCVECITCECLRFTCGWCGEAQHVRELVGQSGRVNICAGCQKFLEALEIPAERTE